MSPRVIALSGGVGGAKLVLGLARVLGGDDLLVIANTGDDFEHCGFTICPDIDTLLYTLSGRSDTERGWGLAGETWTFMERLRREQPDSAWFQLGDRDLETHRFRTAALKRGETLTEVTRKLAARFGIPACIVPMSDDPVRTYLRVDDAGRETWLPFQEYFVKYACEPVVRAIEYRGCEDARPSPRLDEVEAHRVEAVLIGPSNPFLSIDTILAIPGMTARLRSFGVPIIAVSPIVGGRALRGPAAKILRELGYTVDAVAVARRYAGLIDGLIIDPADRAIRSAVEDLGIVTRAAPTVMVSLEDRVGLAEDSLAFAKSLVPSRNR